jgi:hypothetical protein
MEQLRWNRWTVSVVVALSILHGAGFFTDLRSAPMAYEPSGAPGNPSADADAWQRPWSEDDPSSSSLDQHTRADTTDVIDVLADRWFPIEVDGQALGVGYFGNRSIDDGGSDVTRAVVVLHGTLRNADDYYRAIADGANTAGVAATTLLIAPQYLTERDIVTHSLPDPYIYWAYMGWREGNNSLSSTTHPRPWRISSFAVLDQILLRIAERFPNCRTVVVCGHSAGGQFLNRYAAGARAHTTLKSVYGDSVRYVVSNPSAYMYLDERRWTEGSSYRFVVPSADSVASCPSYDRYKYGLDSPNAYMDIGTNLLRSQYASRSVVYLLGGADTDPNSYYLEKNCESMFQGICRLQRGTVYYNHLGDTYGPGIYTLHRMAFAPRIAHDGYGMFNSSCGLRWLYDFGSCADRPAIGRWQDVTTTLLAAWTGRTAAWADWDGDGDPDLYSGATDAADLLLRNDGGLFRDATAGPLTDPASVVDAAWGDFDNDGRPDLYVARAGQPGKLLRNTSSGFVDATSAALAVTGSVTDVSWADMDNDGDLDLFLTRTDGASNVMLRNDASTFVDATAEPLTGSGTTQSAAWGDYDGDGDVDLYLVNNGANRLLRNDRGGVFVDVTGGPLGDTGNGASASWGDLDNDGDLDLYLVNRGSSNRLFRNDGNGSFVNVASSPVNLSTTGRSAGWGDYDNDGRLDLYVSNSGVNRLFHNEGGGQFSDATDVPLDDNGPTWASAWADYDGDGDLDLYMADENWGNKLFRNLLERSAQASNHWIRIEPIGTFSNRDAVGARVRVLAGGVSRVRMIDGDAGAHSQSPAVASFGLGPAVAVDSIEIRWPSGLVQRMASQTIDRILTVVETPEEVRIGPDGTGVGCLSSLHPCSGPIPIRLTRDGNTRIRRYEVVVSIGPDLTLCGGIDGIREGSFLSEAGETSFHVVEAGEGRYTVSAEIVSGGGANAREGTLFTIDCSRAGTTGSGRIFVVSAGVEASAGFTWSAAGGPGIDLPIDAVAPTIEQLRSHAVFPAVGPIAPIAVDFTMPEDAVGIEVWRAPFGGYPAYDGDSGAIPAVPGWADPPPAPWIRTEITLPGQFDRPATRDVWYYAGFARDACGNISAVPATTGGTPNYLLGDVSDGVTPGTGDGRVDVADISMLGGAYYETPGPQELAACLDVGPTGDGSGEGRPLTDGIISFEDLMIFAMNLGDGSDDLEGKNGPVGDAARGAVKIVWKFDPSPLGASDFIGRILLSPAPETSPLPGVSEVKGIHVRIGMPEQGLRLDQIEQGELLAHQSQVLFLHHSGSRSVDVDIAVLGRGAAFEGTGELAALHFQRVGVGMPSLPFLAETTLRDADNSAPASPARASRGLESGERAALNLEPTRSGDVSPNPAVDHVDIRFDLGHGERVSIAIYDVGGRRVRSLVGREMEQGRHSVSWDLRTDDGRRVGPGTYLYRVVAGQVRITGLLSVL